MKILVSAGEASGDLYSAELASALKRRFPDAEFFGCTGSRMREAGVRTIVDAANLSVVGLVEVVGHLPRIYGEFRKLLKAAALERPVLAILTDSPDFHLRLARKLKRQGIPVIYLIAPQVWAWRTGRVRMMRCTLDRLLCIFPFEIEFFRKHGVPADYIGHPLTRVVLPNYTRDEFLRKHGIDGSRPVITILPGSRPGEIGRHLPILRDAACLLHRELGAHLILAAPPQFSAHAGPSFLSDRLAGAPVQVVEGETWDAIAHSTLVLAASGTVTVEAAILGTPMVTFYRVTPVSWWLGQFLVKVPFYTMVNLIAGRKIVPEYMQDEMTGTGLANAAKALLADPTALAQMRRDLAEVKTSLSTPLDPIDRAAEIVSELLLQRN